MFRRARFSVKPNVRPNTTGRGGGGGGSSSIPAAASLSAVAPKDSAPTPGSSAEDPALLQPGDADRVGDIQPGSGRSRSEKTSDASSQRGCNKHAETLLQRRKRISTVPNLAKPRVAPSPVQRPPNLASKCPPRQVSHSSTFGTSPLQKELPSFEKANVENSPKSPVLPEKKTPVPQVPQFTPLKKSINKEPNAYTTTQRSEEAFEKNLSTPLKERPTQEKTLQEEVSSQTQSKSPLVKESKICSDREKIIKTKKLRKMLKEELKKEKEQRKHKSPIIEKTIPEDRSKMIMRDFIYYLPENNPMKSSLVEEKTAEKTSTVTQSKEPEERLVADHVDENEEDDDEEEEEDGPLLVPRVKVAEDGTIILDEESLTVEVLRTKGQCVVEENDPIFERGSTTTYSSFRRNCYTKPWSEKETEMFFLAISMVGTDFSMISQLFPHRARTEIKNKFKREEKTNGWRIDKAFKEKKPFDFTFFAKLLEKVLENERRRKEKDAKCQRQKERNANEKKISKSQKKQQVSVVNGQHSHSQDDLQHAHVSDTEMEVDVETAEKENEEALSLLEQAEGLAVPESVVTKKKRKRKKKDSDHEMENIPDETVLPFKTAEEERSRKKRKNISPIEIDGINKGGEGLEVPNGVPPDEVLSSVEDDLHCYTLDEETEGGDASSIHGPGEVDALEAVSEHHTEQPSESPDPTTEICAAKNLVPELDKWDDNRNMASPHHENEIRKTKRAVTKKAMEEEQQQIITSDSIRTSEKREPLVDDILEVKTSSQSVDGKQKSVAENKAVNITGAVIDEACRTNKEVDDEAQETEKSPEEKTEFRSRWQRPTPNILMASCRKEARIQSKVNKPDPDEIERKNTVSEEIHSTNTERIPEKESCGSDTEHLAVKKSTLQESSKRSTLKPAPLARGRIQRPQPNLGRLFRRQGGLAKNTEKEEGKRTETGVGTETCGCSEPLNKNITEAATNEVDTTPSAELENKTVASGEQVGSVHMIQHPETKPLECEGHKLQTTSLSSSSLEDVTDLVTRDISLQQEQKEFLTETEDSLKNYSPSQNQSLEKLADEASLLQIKEEKLNKKDETETTEHSLININRECIKSSNLDEEANFRIMPGTDNQEAVTTSEPLLSTPSSLDFKSGEQNEVLLHSDNQEKNSVGAENSQGVSKQSTIRPALLPRSRFQKPKPNIGRAVGRKEVQSLEENETIETVTAVEKLELKKSERIEIPISFTKPSQSLPAEALEKKSVDNEKIILEDSQVLITSHNISDQCLRENPVLQERKPSVIKPAQLVRGRFQRARPSLGRIHDKKQGTVSENTNAPVENEVGKYSMEIFKTSDLDPPSKDEVSVQASLDNVGRKEDSESSEGTLSKRCIVQKLPSPENLQESLVLIPEGKAHLSKDEGKHLDIPESDISAPQEISQLKNTKPAQPRRRHLQKPKPDVTQASENKDAISSEDVSLEDVAERDTENYTTPCGSISGEISTLIHISQTLVEAASVAKSPKEKTCADGVETVSLKRSEHSERFDSSEQPSRSENQTKKEVSKPVSVQERHFKGKQPVRTLKQKKNCGDSRTFSPSEWEDDGSKKRKHHPKNKAHVSRGKSLKTSLRKKPRKECGSAKVSLVTLRASSQEEEEDDDGDDFEPDYELECFSPEEVNKAPVFVPRGLRSPNPVPVQIEETMEELEIYENVADELCLPYEVPPDAQTMIQEEQLCSSQVFIEEEQKENTGIIYGSTEAAMTLLAMRDPVFQLNIVTQENQLEHAIKDELSATDSLHTEPSEPEKAFPCNELCSTASKIELVSSMSVNRSTTEDYSTESPGTDNCFQEEVNVPLPTSSKNELVPSHHTKGLGECSQETSIASSDSPVSKGNKTTIPARCRFPKPKPNLNRCLGLRRKVPPKSLGLLSEEEQLNNIKNDNKVSGNSTEERKVQLEQNLKSIEVVQSSSEEKHDFQPGNGENAMQKTNTERKDLAKETWEVAWESTTPEAAAHFQGLLSSCNTNMDGQISTLAGHEISTVDEAQIEALKQSSISVTREITAVSCSMKEYPTTEEEPTFILTLVEIPADSEDCGGGPVLLQQTPGELLPATVLFTPANTDAVELTGEDSTRFIPTAEEGNATCINSSTESKELHTLASERLTDSGSASWNNLKNSPEALEGSCDPNGKERLASSNEEDLKSSNKEISPKLQRIPEEPDENSEKLNVSKKKSVSTSESVAELNVKEKEQPLSFPNLAVQLEEADRSDEQMSRMLYVGKTEKVEEQRNIVDTCKSVQPKQGGHKRALPKAQLSRSNQRTPGFLPLICKDNADEEMTTKLHKELLQETEIIASKSTTKSPVSSRHNKEEAQEDISLLSAIPGSSTSGKGSFYNTQVSSGLSDCEGSSKEQEKEEEPTRISEYFFSDIFMEVDDSE